MGAAPAQPLTKGPTVTDAPRLTPSQALLAYFSHEHLPQSPLRQVSSIIGNHARYLDAVLPDGPEKTTGLRKLLEAKDCFVRAALALPDDTKLPAAVDGT